MGGLVALCVANWPLLHVGVAATAAYGGNLLPPADGRHLYNTAAIDFLKERTDFKDGVSVFRIKAGPCSAPGSSHRVKLRGRERQVPAR